VMWTRLIELLGDEYHPPQPPDSDRRGARRTQHHRRHDVRCALCPVPCALCPRASLRADGCCALLRALQVDGCAQTHPRYRRCAGTCVHCAVSGATGYRLTLCVCMCCVSDCDRCAATASHRHTHHSQLVDGYARAPLQSHGLGRDVVMWCCGDVVLW
jgi:hypothetical protein